MIAIGVIIALIFLTIFICGIYYLKPQGAAGQASTLRQKGIFRYTRNPMYIGVSMVLVGVGLILLNTGVIIGGLLWLCFTFTQAKREEKELAVRFGKEYKDYKLSTPLFIPNVVLIIQDTLNKKR